MSLRAATADEIGSTDLGDRAPSVAVTAVALIAWALLVGVSVVWGHRVVDQAPEPIFVDAVPFYGQWDALLTWRWGLAVVGALLGVWLLPRVVQLASWPMVLTAVAVAAAMWTLALGVVEAPADAWRNIYGDYGQFIPLVEAAGPGGFLRDYVANQLSFPTHLSAHPPGMMILLWALAQAGLAGLAVDAALAVVAVAVSCVAVLMALRELAGEARARLAAPFVVLAPAAIWHTNADVVFGAFGLWGICLAVLATGRRDRRGVGLAVAGGVLLGCAVMMTYGVTLLAVPVVVVAVARRRVRSLAYVAAGGLATLLLPLPWGFWWLDGLEATKEAYDLNLARVRPYGYFVVANLAVFAVALGPATAVALTRLRDRSTWLLVGGGLLAVLVANATGLSLAETERIWQPFMPLVLLAGCALTGNRMASRGWLGLQVTVSLFLVLALRSPW